LLYHVNCGIERALRRWDMVANHFEDYNYSDLMVYGD
jgi:hypothetical protein